MKKRKRTKTISHGDSDIWEFKIYKFKIQKVGEFASRFLNGKPIQKKDTCRLLREILLYSRKGRYHVHLINERRFRYPKGLVIDIFERQHVDLIYNAENRERRFFIDEASISGLLFDFIHGFESSPYVYTEEETVAWLEEQIRQAEESVNKN